MSQPMRILLALLAGLGAAHLLEEVFLPLGATARTKAAIAYEERPWPPAGVGSRALRGVALAVVSDDGQGLLTPVMLSPQHGTNVGLASALTKLLFEDLRESGVDSVCVFVNERSKLVAGELTRAGFAPRQARVLTGQTQFVAYAAEPAAALRALGLADARTGGGLRSSWSARGGACSDGGSVAAAGGAAATAVSASPGSSTSGGKGGSARLAGSASRNTVRRW